MRKRRAVVLDDDVFVLSLLKDFLIIRGYEVLSYHEPAVCPLSENSGGCGGSYPCADVMITDFNMPKMSGVELLRHQSKRGCPVDVRNKAVTSGYLSAKQRKGIEELGCAFFRKPFIFSELSAWLVECEKRADLSRPLASRRRETRYDSYKEIAYEVIHTDELLRGIAVNISDSGLCLKLRNPLLMEQVVRINTSLPNACHTASVRWIKKGEDGSYMAGLARC